MSMYVTATAPTRCASLTVNFCFVTEKLENFMRGFENSTQFTHGRVSSRKFCIKSCGRRALMLWNQRSSCSFTDSLVGSQCGSLLKGSNTWLDLRTWSTDYDCLSMLSANQMMIGRRDTDSQRWNVKEGNRPIKGRPRSEWMACDKQWFAASIHSEDARNRSVWRGLILGWRQANLGDLLRPTGKEQLKISLFYAYALKRRWRSHRWL